MSCLLLSQGVPSDSETFLKKYNLEQWVESRTIELYISFMSYEQIKRMMILGEKKAYMLDNYLKALKKKNPTYMMLQI